MFSDTVHTAAAHAREALAIVNSRAAATALKRMHSDTASFFRYTKTLTDSKVVILPMWLKAVKGHVAGPTLFGSGEGADALYSKLFDVLVATLCSRADPPSDAPLIAFCGELMPPTADKSRYSDAIISGNTVKALLLFEDVACTALAQRTEQRNVRCRVSRALCPMQHLSCAVWHARRAALCAVCCLSCSVSHARRAVPDGAPRHACPAVLCAVPRHLASEPGSFSSGIRCMTAELCNLSTWPGWSDLCALPLSSKGFRNIHELPSQHAWFGLGGAPVATVAGN